MRVARHSRAFQVHINLTLMRRKEEESIEGRLTERRGISYRRAWRAFLTDVSYILTDVS